MNLKNYCLYFSMWYQGSFTHFNCVDELQARFGHVLDNADEVPFSDLTIVCGGTATGMDGAGASTQSAATHPAAATAADADADSSSLDSSSLSCSSLATAARPPPRGHTLKAHRFVLSAWSRPFLAMLTSGMKEAREQTLHLEDVDLESMQVMRKFMYTGVACLSNDNVSRVMKVANQFEVLALRNCCDQFLNRQINPESCWALLAMSEGGWAVQAGRGDR